MYDDNDILYEKIKRRNFLIEKLDLEEDRKYIDDNMNYDTEGAMYDKTMNMLNEKPLMCSNCKTILKRNDMEQYSIHGGKDTPLVLEFKCKKCGNVCLKYCYHNADGTLKQLEKEEFKVRQ